MNLQKPLSDFIFGFAVHVSEPLLNDIRWWRREQLVNLCDQKPLLQFLFCYVIRVCNKYVVFCVLSDVVIFFCLITNEGIGLQLFFLSFFYRHSEAFFAWCLVLVRGNWFEFFGWNFEIFYDNLLKHFVLSNIMRQKEVQQQCFEIKAEMENHYVTELVLQQWCTVFFKIRLSRIMLIKLYQERNYWYCQILLCPHVPCDLAEICIVFYLG